MASSIDRLFMTIRLLRAVPKRGNILTEFQAEQGRFSGGGPVFLFGVSSGGEAVQIPEQVGAVDQAGGVALARIAKAGASDSPLSEQFVKLGSGKPREINGLRDSNPERRLSCGRRWRIGIRLH